METINSSMSDYFNIEYHEFPYPHAICDSAIEQNTANSLYDFANKIAEEDISFVRKGEQQDNMQMWNNKKGIDTIHPEYHNEVYRAFERTSKLFKEYDSQNRKWSISLTETNREYGNFLTPHTDDPVLLKERDPEMEHATIKGLLYLAEDRTKYDHYGTKLYMNDDRSSFVKEVEFVQCRLFLWSTGENSYHGTDFIKGLPHRRIFYTGEYLIENATSENPVYQVDDGYTGTENG